MALSQSTLATGIETMLDSLASPSAPSAEQAWGDTFGEYFKGAVWSGIPVLPASVDALKTTMASAMTFVNDGTGGVVLQNGFTAFWAAIVAAPATYWPTMVVATPPPGVATFASSIAPVFVTNNAPGITRAQAAANMATVIHSICGLGGTGAIPPAAPTPIT